MQRLLFILLVFTACNNKPQPQENLEENNTATPVTGSALPVHVTVLNQTVFNKQIIANGKIEAQQKTNLHFKTTERIAIIYVTNGQYVTKGQLLANLDNTLLNNELEKARINLQKAKTQLQEELINYTVNDSANVTSELMTNLQIKTGVLEAQNQLQNAQIRYNQTLLKAPFSGIIANIQTKQGDYITPADPFCTVIAPKKMEVSFSVLEDDLRFIKKQQQITFTPFTQDNKQYTATITQINPLVDKNGLIQIKAQVTQSKDLIDGMNVKIIVNHPVTNTVVVPKEALVLRSNKEVVFTVSDSLAKWKYVEIIDENTTSYAVKKGVKIGDTVIVSGNMNLSHDAKIAPKLINNQEQE